MPQPRKRKMGKPLGRTFIREWRQYRGYTLMQLAEMVGTTHGHLSTIERGLKPYDQTLLELLAEALTTNPASLLMRNPQEPGSMWTLWDRAKPEEKRQIEDIAEVIVGRTGTNG